MFGVALQACGSFFFFGVLGFRQLRVSSLRVRSLVGGSLWLPEPRIHQGQAVTRNHRQDLSVEQTDHTASMFEAPYKDLLHRFWS